MLTGSGKKSNKLLVVLSKIELRNIGISETVLSRGRQLVWITLGFFCALFIENGTAQEANTNASSDIQLKLHPGLHLSEREGKILSIERKENLQGSPWECVDFYQLVGQSGVWVDRKAAIENDQFYRAVPFSPPEGMVFIPPGTFRMGSPEKESGRDDDELQVDVILTKGFWMGATEVTQSEYEKVMGNNPSDFQGNPNRPVDSVSWFEAVEYCEKLTEVHRESGVIPDGAAYRLPTSAEWEYACRAWTSTRFNYGEDPAVYQLFNYAWEDKGSGVTTHPVGQLEPNAWGLYDMHGNVWEYCQDWFGNSKSGLHVDPQGPSTGNFKIQRGGGIFEDSNAFRCARKNWTRPELRFRNLGFRVVLAALQ